MNHLSYNILIFTVNSTIYQHKILNIVLKKRKDFLITKIFGINFKIQSNLNISNLDWDWLKTLRYPSISDIKGLILKV